jgi:hypothetical protein
MIINLNNACLHVVNYASFKIAVKNTFSNVNNFTIIKPTFTNHYFQFARAGLTFEIWPVCTVCMPMLYCGLNPYQSFILYCIAFLQVSDK